MLIIKYFTFFIVICIFFAVLFEKYRIEKGYALSLNKTNKIMTKLIVLYYLFLFCFMVESVLILPRFQFEESISVLVVIFISTAMFAIFDFGNFNKTSIIKCIILVIILIFISSPTNFNRLIFSSVEKDKLSDPYNFISVTYQIDEETKCMKYEDLQGTSKITQEPAALVYCYNSKDPEYGMYYYYIDGSYKAYKSKDFTLVEIPSSSNSSCNIYAITCYRYNLTDNGFFYFNVAKKENILYVKEDQIIKIDLAAL